MECRLAGETEVLGENLPQHHFCPSQNPTWPDLGLNLGRCGGKPATHRLSYGAAIIFRVKDEGFFFNFSVKKNMNVFKCFKLLVGWYFQCTINADIHAISCCQHSRWEKTETGLYSKVRSPEIWWVCPKNRQLYETKAVTCHNEWGQ
jgi:hypothetical protein